MPTTDPGLVTFAGNYNAVSIDNATELGLSAPELAALDLAVTEFDEAYAAVLAAKYAYEGAVAQKNIVRSALTTVIRTYTREFKSNPSVSEDTLGKLGVLVSNPSGPVTAVTNLSAIGCSNGENQLRWNRNGNGKGTQFIIEAKYGASTAWQLVDVVTATRYAQQGQTPGVQVTYRVTSIRAGVRSQPCDPFVLYPSSGSNSFLQAA